MAFISIFGFGIILATQASLAITLVIDGVHHYFGDLINDDTFVCIV